MEITHRRLNRVDIVGVSGRLTNEEAPSLQRQLNELFAEGRHRILLDFSKLEYISSPGLRVMIEARKRCREWKYGHLERGDVRIVNMPPRIKEVFDLTDFTSLFHIYDDIVKAIGGYTQVDIIDVFVRLTAAEAPELEARLQELYSHGRYRIVLDFRKLDYISGPGLRTLIEARKRCRETKIDETDRGDVRIVGIPPRIKEVFDLTGFTSMFHLYDDMVDAVGSF